MNYLNPTELKRLHELQDKPNKTKQEKTEQLKLENEYLFNEKCRWNRTGLSSHI